MSKPSSHPVLLSAGEMLADMQVRSRARLAAGVSGGLDSMVLLHILRQLGYPVTALHVNFQLRGSDAEEDARFVDAWCKAHDIPVLTHTADTVAYMEESGLNTQLAARKLRYDWWNHLLHLGQYDFIVTAHHLDDSIETLLLNVIRGTGLKGLHGIASHRGLYLRPLLRCSRTELEDYAQTYDIPFRTDASNQEDTYDRNRLRHHVIPLLRDMYPGFYARFRHTFYRINMEWAQVDQLYQQWILDQVKPAGEGYSLTYDPLQIAFLLRWLEEKGIPWKLAEQYVLAPVPDSGKVLHYRAYRLSRSKEGFFLDHHPSEINITIPSSGYYRFGDIELSIERQYGHPDWEDSQPDTVYVRGDVMQWPLTIRQVVPGDRFQPLGMNGQSKKLQDFAVDLKLDSHEKARMLLLTNVHHIIWVMGYRLDERARVSGPDEEVYKLTMSRCSGR